MTSGKKYPQIDFEEIINVRKYPAEKIFCTEEKHLSWLIMLGKYLISSSCMSGKKIISPEVLGKKFLSKTPASKSNARPLTNFSCIDGYPISIGMGLRYKNCLQ